MLGIGGPESSTNHRSKNCMRHEANHSPTLRENDNRFGLCVRDWRNRRKYNAGEERQLTRVACRAVPSSTNVVINFNISFKSRGTILSLVIIWFRTAAVLPIQRGVDTGGKE